MSDDTWDPARYHRFREQRERPLDDLLQLVAPFPGGRLVDLGCGTGELTVRAMERTGAVEALGIDSSPAMLAAARRLRAPGVRFEAGDLAAPDPPGRWDLVLANASLHWAGDHPAVLAGWRSLLVDGGQLAVQVPANPDHPSHTTITEVLLTEPFRSAIDGPLPPDPLESVLTPDRYAELLWSLGATEQVVRCEVYGMEMASADEVADWTSGTALNRARGVLDPAAFVDFEQRYRERLGEVLAHAEPYFYAFKRILMWARF